MRSYLNLVRCKKSSDLSFRNDSGILRSHISTHHQDVTSNEERCRSEEVTYYDTEIENQMNRKEKKEMKISRFSL